MTNKDMIKKAPERGGNRPEAMPRPNPPAGVGPAFQKDPDYPAIDPPDSNELKPTLNEPTSERLRR